MAFENLFIRTQRSIAGIQLDGVIVESHNNSLTLTKNPIELGAQITDHAIIEPKRLFMEAEVTDTPLGTAAVGELVDEISGFFGSATVENLTRSSTAYNNLVQLQEAREPISIQTKLVLYNNFILTNINVTQDKDSSRKVVLLMTFEEVIITETEVVEIPAEQLEAGPTTTQAASNQELGRQEPKEPTPAVEKTVLKSITDFF